MSQSEARRSLAIPSAAVAIATFFFLSPSRADEPGTGATALVEQRYLLEAIDHHYTALLLTELAAGAELDAPPTAIVLAENGPSAKIRGDSRPRAERPEVLSLARRSYRAQHDEIERAQEFLRDWYGVEHEPVLREEDARKIAHLSTLPAGAAFDAEFLRIFSQHQADLLVPTLQCIVGADLDHRDLDRYCQAVLRTQMTDVEEMRALLCRFHGDCGFVVTI